MAACGCPEAHRPDYTVWYCGNPTYKCNRCRFWSHDEAKIKAHIVRHANREVDGTNGEGVAVAGGVL
jgi:hypothetical protein